MSKQKTTAGEEGEEEKKRAKVSDTSTTSMERLASRITSGEIRKIVFLNGAGISTASGIPDFRSPGGMYDTLRPELITATPAQREAMRQEPTLVVDFQLFRENQFPYLEVRRPFILGAGKKWKPTLAHAFMKVCESKGLLRRIYTQNIDGLDYMLGLPQEKIINVHGSISKVSCEFCGVPHDTEQFREAVRTKIRNIYDPTDEEAPSVSSNINCESCGRAGLKPSTVMYGRNLPDNVEEALAVDMPDETDLLIVAGTSLTVFPACGYVTRVGADTPRLVCNLEPVGEELGLQYTHSDSEEGSPSRDLWLKGTADECLLQLASTLGWVDDLAVYEDMICDGSRELLRKFLEEAA